MGRFKLCNLGERFGRLVVIGYAEPRASLHGKRHAQVVCRCDCGTTKTILLYSIRLGLVHSCGCFRRETAAAIGRVVNTTHGGSRARTYKWWTAIKSRCFCETDKDFKNYGGRGVAMHGPWVTNYAAFIEYVNNALGPRPLMHSIDRIDNDGNYEPGNLRWATAKEQRHNQRPRQRSGAHG